MADKAPKVAGCIGCFIGVMGLLVIVAMFSTIYIGCNTQQRYYNHKESFDAQVIRKYEFVNNGQTTYRVDIRRDGSDRVQTIQNTDDPRLKKWDSATIHANLTEGEWYTFDVVGVRDEAYSLFPNIMSARKAQK